ncbi:MAG: MBL fold metallo-hydrolase [Candidatus Aminicenantes bacterium]|nr:MBL fold metallo-hydrolase [Candidatus Aminicenantes bacterium]
MIEAPPVGEAVVWYLGHCGYAVRTQNHFLIFDYQEKRDGPQPKTRPENPSLNSGWIVPEEIKGLKVRVFVSHSHTDHYDKVIHEWKKTIPDIEYFFGWSVPKDPLTHAFPGPRTGLISGGMEIATINSHHSGVPESAWLVEVDGLVIYHNGDCQPPNPVAEHEYLRSKTDRIDLAFIFPILDKAEKYGVQNRDLLKRFRVNAAFPMHMTSGDPMYLEFKKVVQAEFPGQPIHLPMRMGQQYTYAKGRIVD